MGLRLKIEGAEKVELGDHSLKTMEFTMDTPDDANARSTDVINTIKVTGKILTAVNGEEADDTIKLAKWSVVRAEKADSYRKVTAEMHTADQVVRKVHFPNAFVVDYAETYGDEDGNGTFSLTVRQKKDKIEGVTIEGGYDV